MKEWNKALLRRRNEEGAPVTSIELFFDLVYALAVTQLTEFLLHNLNWEGLEQSLVLLLAVWWTWNYTAWFTNYFEPEQPLIRLVLVLLTLASLAMSGSLPSAFGAGGILFGAGYVTLQIGRTVFAVAVLGRHALGPVFQRALARWSLTSVLWISGGLIQPARLGLWAVAVGVELLGVAAGFPTPGLGRSRTRDYTISGEHMAERCRLFILLALGESILIAGQHVDDIWRRPWAVVAFIVAFAGVVALWAAYFSWDAVIGQRAMARTADPGRLGIWAFGSLHVPMLAGIVMTAAADEIAITQPTAAMTVWTAALIVGGPAIFLAGSTLYGWVIERRLPVPRLVGVAGLCAVAPFTPLMSATAGLAAAIAVLMSIVAYDGWARMSVGAETER